MMIGRRRRRPASCMASISGTPFLRSSLMASSFRMESLMMIPQVTTMPMALIRFMVWPHIHSTSKEAATSIGISSSTISGCRKLSNWAARMKYISRIEINKITINSFSICRLEKKLPEKSISQSVSIPFFTSSINCSALSIS